MKKILVFIGLLLFGNHLISQDQINQFDSDNLRHGKWIVKYPGTDVIKFKGSFNHGKEVGEFEFFDEQGNQKALKIFQEEDISTVLIFYPDGNVNVSGSYKGKHKQGKWLYFNTDKSVLSEENYHDDLLNGLKKVYFSNGNIAEEKYYIGGVLNGERKMFYENGEIQAVEHYKNGIINGHALYFDEKGNKISEGDYLDGDKIGTWTNYEDGKLKDLEKF